MRGPGRLAEAKAFLRAGERDKTGRSCLGGNSRKGWVERRRIGIKYFVGFMISPAIVTVNGFPALIPPWDFHLSWWPSSGTDALSPFLPSVWYG